VRNGVCAGSPIVSDVQFVANPKQGHSGDTRPSLARLRRVDGRSGVSRRVKRLIATYKTALGRAQIDAGGPFLAERLRTLAELSTLTECLRQDGLAGKHVDYVALVRIENRAARLARALGLGGLLADVPEQTGLSEDMAADIAALFKAPRRRRAR
jgi:hypothetical protein